MNRLESKINAVLEEHGMIPTVREAAMKKIAAAVTANAEQSVAIINSPSALKQFMTDFNVRDDFHEPDEQGLNAVIIGDHLDNAMGSTADHAQSCGEFNVIITQVVDANEENDIVVDVAAVNLAHLLAWASRAGESK